MATGGYSAGAAATSGLGGVGMVDEKDLGMFGLKKGGEPIVPKSAAEAKAPAPAAANLPGGAQAGGPPLAGMSDSAKAMMARAKELEAAADMEENAEEGPVADEEAVKLLEAFQESKGREAAARVFGNLLRVLERLAAEPKNAKLHKMRTDVLERILDGKELIPVLELAAFEQIQEANGTILKWKGADAKEGDPDSDKGPQLKTVVRAVQKVVDAMLDPDTVDFQTVMKLVSENRQLPGIKDVNDKVETRIEPKASTAQKPLKPWEKPEAIAKAKAAAEAAEAAKKESGDTAEKKDDSA